MAKALTASALTKFKADPSKRLEIPDGILAGLYFVIQPTGRKSWAIRYRYQGAPIGDVKTGQPRKMALGNYLAGTDADLAGKELIRIRTEAAEILERVRQGDDPAGQKQIAKKQAKDEDTADRTRFDGVVKLFLTRYAKPKNRSWKDSARHIGLVPDKAKPDEADDPKSFVAVKRTAADRWGHRPIADIRRADVIALLDDIVDEGKPILANRVLAALRKLFNWALERDLVETNPCDRVKPPASEKARDRVLSDDELRALWKAADDLAWPFGRHLQMLILTGQRRDEVAGMKWREISGDTWTLPRDRAKTDKAHEVPLSPPALSILETLPKIEGAAHVFTTTGKTPISGFGKPKATMHDKMVEILRKEAEERGDDPDAIEVAPWRLHDIRRTVASGMARLGINIAVIEKVLNHTSGTFAGIVGVYQRHEFTEEKRRALEAWANFLDRLMNDEPSGNVIELRAAQ